MPLCPTCFTEIGTFTDDPILTTPELSLGYSGFTIIKPTHIIELQNQRNLEEIEAGLTPSTWTYIDNTNFYQVVKTCIEELRTSTENLLTEYSKTKYDYFNYDADGNYMGTTQNEWYEPDLDDKYYQVKAIHIEDLRHPVPVAVSWEEDWVGATFTKTDSAYAVPPSAPSHYEYNISFSGRKSWLIDTIGWALGSGGNPQSGSFGSLDYTLTTSGELKLITDLHTKVIATNQDGGTRSALLRILIKTDFLSGTKRKITASSNLTILGDIGITLYILGTGFVYFIPGNHSLSSYVGKTILYLYIGNTVASPYMSVNYSVLSRVFQNVPPYPPLVTSTDEDQITPGFALTKISITNLIV